MRFVGGQVSHTGSAQIATPNGVVGIRGGVGIIGTHQVFIGFGQGTVTSGSSSVTLDAGEYTAAGARSAADATRASATRADRQTAADLPKPGGAGRRCAGQPQCDQSGASSGHGLSPTVRSSRWTCRTGPRTSVNSLSRSLNLNQAIETQSNAQPPVLGLIPDLLRRPHRRLPPATLPVTQPQPPTQTPPTSPPPPATPPPPQYSSGPAFTFAMSNCCGPTGPTSSAPYLPATFATGDNRFVSQGMGYRPPNQQVSTVAMPPTSIMVPLLRPISNGGSASTAAAPANRPGCR